MSVEKDGISIGSDSTPHQLDQSTKTQLIENNNIIIQKKTIIHNNNIDSQINADSVHVPSKWNPGDLVWAKFPGWPWWPGKIEDEYSLPLDLKKDKNDPRAVGIPISSYYSGIFFWWY
jgi:hypothetical protein